MFRNYLLRPLLVVSLLVSVSTNSRSQYADLGTGALKERIWWLDWDGFAMANGASRTFNTSNGLTVTVTFSNVSGPLLTPTVMNTWYGAVLHLLYNFSNTAVKPALYHSSYQTALTNFTLNVTATRNGLPVPVQLIVADAEASATTEITTLKTNGSNWSMIDFFRNSAQTSNPLTGCNTATVTITDTYGNAAQVGQNPVLRTGSPVSGPLSVEVTMDHSNIMGQMGLAFGILEAVDRGDLPPGYGFAQHQIQYAFNNVCNHLPPLPSATQTTNLRLGNAAGDADGIQTTDDNANGSDEDAVGTFPPYALGGTYSLTLPLANTTGSTTHLSGWFDHNGNGLFENGERQTVAVANGASSATLTWTGLPSSFSGLVKYGFRFRLSSDQTAVQSPTGFAADGEVEDYSVVIPQSFVPAFTMPDTVCVDAPVTITNVTTGATNYYWNFCVANSATNPLGTNIGTFGLTLPVFMDYAKEGNNYYGFVTNNLPGRLVRLNFGNSLLNTPTTTDLGNLGGVIPDFCEGIQVVKNEGKWYVLAVGGQPVGRVVKIDFGASLSNNTPTATNWGNVGGLAYPTDLHVFQDGTNWYGLTINAQTNTITRFNFTSSFSNSPTGINLGNVGGLAYPSGIYAITKNGLWHAFVINSGNGNANSTNASITRLDFGNSLLNTPTGVNLGNPGNTLSGSRDITIYQSCNEIFGFAVNYSTTNDIVRLNFNNSLTATPSAVSIGNTGSLNFPHSISKLFRDGNDLYAFITNVNGNSITRLKFNGCTNASTASSTLQNPPVITYNAPGIYNVNLTVDDGLPTQSAVCKQVVVVDNTHTPLQQKSFCTGDSVLLTSSKPTGNTWSTGSTAASIYVSTTGTFWVRSTTGSCTNVDSFAVTTQTKPAVNLGKDTSLCSTDTLLLNAGNTGASYLWQTGQTTQAITVKQGGLYYVDVTANGCTSRDSIVVNALASPSVNVSNDTALCKPGGTAVLVAGGGGTYSWWPATALSSTTGNSTNATPDTTTTYHVTVTAANGCKAIDSVTVSVYPTPAVNIGKDTSLCTLDSLTLDAGNAGASFAWQNGQGTQKLMVKAAGLYHVAVTKNGCTARDSVLIEALASPVLTLSDDTTMCKPGSVTLTAAGADVYTWSPAAGLSGTSGASVTAAPDTTTIYYADVANNNGCKARDSVAITVYPTPVVQLGDDRSFCSLDSMVLNAGNPGASFMWQDGSTGQAFVAKQPGEYHVLVTANGCAKRDTVLLSTKPSPVVSVSADTAICRNGSAVLQGSGGAVYEWWPTGKLSDSTANTVTASPDTTTTFRLRVTNADNCSAIDSVTVTVNPAPVFSAGSSKPLVCENDTATLFAGGGDAYAWSPTHSLGNSTDSITAAYPDSTTLYKVVIEHVACRVTDSLFVRLNTGDNPVVSLAKSNDINCFQGVATLTASGGNRYLWRPLTGLSNPQSRNPQVAITVPTTYTVTAISRDGCETEDSITVFVGVASEGSGFVVPSAFTPNGDGKNDCFGVPHWGAVTKFSLNLYNRWGERVFHADSPSQCWDGYYKGVLQPNAVFVYWIEAETFCGKVFRKGTFALVR